MTYAEQIFLDIEKAISSVDMSKNPAKGDEEVRQILIKMFGIDNVRLSIIGFVHFSIKYQNRLLFVFYKGASGDIIGEVETKYFIIGDTANQQRIQDSLAFHTRISI
jgi:hypothetical protein